MTPAEVIWGCTWRGAFWGALAGAALGSGIGLLVLSTGGVAIGAALATPGGLFLGLLNGAVIGYFTAKMYLPLRDAHDFMRAVRWGSVIVTFAAGVLLCVAVVVMIAKDTSPDNSLLIFFGVMPTLFAATIAALASPGIVKWYVVRSSLPHREPTSEDVFYGAVALVLTPALGGLIVYGFWNRLIENSALALVGFSLGTFILWWLGTAAWHQSVWGAGGSQLPRDKRRVPETRGGARR